MTKKHDARACPHCGATEEIRKTAAFDTGHWSVFFDSGKKLPGGKPVLTLQDFGSKEEATAFAGDREGRGAIADLVCPAGHSRDARREYVDALMEEHAERLCDAYDFERSRRPEVKAWGAVLADLRDEVGFGVAVHVLGEAQALARLRDETAPSVLAAMPLPELLASAGSDTPLAQAIAGASREADAQSGAYFPVAIIAQSTATVTLLCGDEARG